MDGNTEIIQIIVGGAAPVAILIGIVMNCAAFGRRNTKHGNQLWVWSIVIITVGLVSLTFDTFWLIRTLYFS